MRQRTTWQNKSRETARQAATQRRADDIYDMNGEHPQPTATEYETGSPDTWAESLAPDRVAEEYDGDHVARNEVGFGEFRKDTFNGSGSKPWGSGKYASSSHKASAATKIATVLVGGSDKSALKQVATAVMAMPDGAVAMTVKAIQASSPSSLPQASRFKRAVACTKIATRILGSNADEQTVEKLARCLYSINDSILRPMVKIVASVRYAQEEEEQQEQQGQEQEEQQEQQGQEQEEEEEEEEGGSPVKSDSKSDSGVQVSQEQEEQQEQQGQEQQEQQEQQGQEQEEQQEQQGQEQEEGYDGLTAEEACMLEGLLNPAGGQPGVNLMLDHHDAPVGQPAMGQPAMPVQVGSGPQIVFDEDDTSDGNLNVASLEDLFNDDPEVKAQREILASQNPGYDVRTASTKPKGAKKLGTVQAAKAATVSAQLESIWDRP